MILMKCADCCCIPEEYKNSKSSKQCPNCTCDEYCCLEVDLDNLTDR